MIDELIDNIRKAESQAEDIVRNAHAMSKDIVSEAHAKAAEIIKNAKTSDKALETRAIKEAERQANDNSVQFINSARADAAEMTLHADKLLDKAVDVIVRRIKIEYETN